MKPKHYLITFFILLLGLSAGLIGVVGQPTQGLAAPADTPELFVSDGAERMYADERDVIWINAVSCANEFSPGCRLRSVPAGGGTIRTIFENPSGTSDDDLISNVTSGADGLNRLYWVNGDGDILELGRYASPPYSPTVISSKENPATGSEVAVDGSYVYWTENVDNPGTATDLGKVFRAPRGGGTRELMRSVNKSTIRQFAADGSGGVLFIADECGFICIPAVLFHVTPNGGGGFTTDNGATAEVQAFATDGADVYWATDLGGDPRIQKAPLSDLSSATTFHDISNSGSPDVRAMAVDGDNLYWHEYRSGGGPIYRKALGGGGAIPITPNLNDTEDLTSNGRHLFWRLDSGSIMRVPINAAASQYDVSISDIEVTQGIQSLDDTIAPANSFVPLIQEKWTLVRVYPALNDSSIPSTSATVRLYGSRDSAPLPGSPLTATYVPARTSGPDRSVYRDTANFVLPASWLQGDVTLQAEITANVLLDTNPANNTKAVTVTFDNKSNICIKFVPILTTARLTYRTRSPLTGSLNFDFLRIKDRFNTLWPPNVRWYTQYLPLRKPQFLGRPQPFNLTGGADAGHVIAALYEHNIFDGAPEWCGGGGARTHYVAMVHPAINTTRVTATGTSTLLGFASFGEPLSLVKMETVGTPDFYAPRGGATMAQEIGHNYNDLFGSWDRWKHVNCGLPAGDDPHDDYPYNPAQIAPTGTRSYWGFDRLSNSIIAPTGAADYMSYCAPVWTSDYNWRGALDATSSPGLAALQIASNHPRVATAEALAVVGQVELDESAADFIAIHRLPSSMLAGQQNDMLILRDEAGITGTYQLELLSASETVLASQVVTPALGSDGGAYIFTAEMPFDSSATRLRLTRDGAEMTQAVISANPPVVSVLSPTAGETVGDPMTIEWTASDADGDEMTYAVQYSADGGSTWSAVVSGHPETTLTVSDTWDLPGSASAQVRVIANDGVNTGMAVSGLFTLLGHDPQAWIQIPADGAAFLNSEAVALEGGALDPEDGPLDGTALQWQVNGPVARSGSGGQLILNDLPPGTYSAQLTATDGDGKSGAAASTFVIKPKAIYDGDLPLVDGYCDDAAYDSDLDPILLRYADGSAAEARFVHAGDDLYVCVSGLPLNAGDPVEALDLRIDLDNSGDTQLQSDDLIFRALKDGLARTGQGDGDGNDSFDALADGLTAGISVGADTWQVEMRIDQDRLGDWDFLGGMQVAHLWNTGDGSEGVWPAGADANSPDTWGEAVFGQIAQSITFVALPDRKLDKSPFLVNASASSGLPVVFSSQTEEVCVVGGNVVTLLAPGTCSLTASQEGGGGYQPAQSVTRQFSVTSHLHTLFLPVLIR